MRAQILALALFCCCGVSSHAPAGAAVEGWWRPEPEGYRKTLQLNEEQAKHIERLFQSFGPWQVNRLLTVEQRVKLVQLRASTTE